MVRRWRWLPAPARVSSASTVAARRISRRAGAAWRLPPAIRDRAHRPPATKASTSASSPTPSAPATSSTNSSSCSTTSSVQLSHDTFRAHPVSPGMRLSSLLFLFFLSLSAAAAPPILGPEVVVGAHAFEPSPIALGAPAVAIASDAHGVAIAWAMPTASQASRIHVARLDANGRIDGPVRVVASRSRRDTAFAGSPSLAPAPDREGFVVAWIEAAGDARITAFAFLDADLNPSPTA